MIGDGIQDTYHTGDILGIANEDPALKFRPTGMVTKKGGAAYCQALLQSFLPDYEIELFLTSHSHIQRFVDNKYKRVVLTVDTEPVEKYPYEVIANHALERFVKSWDPSVLYIWDDDRTPSLPSWVFRLSGLDALPVRGIYLDSSRKNTLGYPVVSYRKASETENILPQQNDHLLITTSASKVEIINAWALNPFARKGTLRPIDYLVPKSNKIVDTCGAGDTFFTAFCAAKEQGKELEEAIHYAISAASLSIEHNGCFLPSLQEIEDRQLEYYG